MESRPCEVLIGNNGGDHVKIHGQPRDSEGWRRVQIEVCCDAWVGRFAGSFQKGELSRFADEIRKLRTELSGVARFNPLEPNIELTMTGDGKGHVVIDGVARNHVHLGTKLLFRFEIDQTYLGAIAKSLNEADE